MLENSAILNYGKIIINLNLTPVVMTKTLYIMCGVGFSGKSTLSKKIAEYKNAVLVSQDDIYFEKERELNLSEDSDKDWKQVLSIAKSKIKYNLTNGRSVVFDHTNLRRSFRDKLRSMAKGLNAEFVTIYLDTPLNLQIERRLKNQETWGRHDVKQRHLDYAHTTLEIPKKDENVLVFTPEKDLNSWLSNLP